MIICDLTHAYSPTSGGIRTYLEAKRRYLLDHTDHTTVLVIPGERDAVERDGRAVTYTVAGPVIPFAAPYRFFPRRSKLEAILHQAQPDLIELNTYYMPPEPQAAFAYRDARRAKGHDSVVALHYHTDFARSYAKYYSQKALGGWLSDRVQGLAERYVRSILGRSDLLLTFSDGHEQQMRELGLADPHIVPQFIDLDMFHPSKADPAFRRSLGIGPDAMMLVYAGRFDTEKHVHTLVNALEALPPDGPEAYLVMAGNGPLRGELEERAASTPNLILLPYQQGKEAVARLVASADIYITAGPHEVAAFSVVEAQACGLPTVGVEAGGLTGRILPGLGFLGPVDDATAMAANIIKAWADRSSLATAARTYVEAHYGLDKSFGAILKHYNQALGAA